MLTFIFIRQKTTELKKELDILKNELIIIDAIMQDEGMSDKEKVKQYFWNLNNLPF
jgi:hypothetical protein